MEDCIKAVKEINLEFVEKQAKRWIQASAVEVLVHGNFKRDDATSLLETFKRGLAISNASVAKSTVAPEYSRVIPLGRFNFNSPPIENINSGIMVYYHLGSIENQETRILGRLLGQILEEPFFDQLRTKEQLGYIVHCSYSEKNAAAGLVFLIQSERSPEYLNHRINEFLAQQNLTEPMKNEAFDKHVQAAYVELTEVKKALNMESGVYMNAIASGYYSHFNKGKNNIFLDSKSLKFICRET